VKDFAAGPGRLRMLPVGAKLLYTAFTLSALVGLVVSWRLYGAVVGGAGAPAYYAGAAVTQPAPAKEAGAGDGPVLDLPEEATAPRVLVEQISDRKLLEVTHFHLFSVPVYVLILAHLWLLARIPAWAQTGGVAVAVAASALHLGAPWLVRGHPSLSALMPVSGMLMLVTLGGMGLGSTVDMWMPKRLK
jgi:hypothetical protein